MRCNAFFLWSDAMWCQKFVQLFHKSQRVSAQTLILEAQRFVFLKSQLLSLEHDWTMTNIMGFKSSPNSSEHLTKPRKCQRCMSAWQRSTQASQKLEIKSILASSSSSHTKVLSANPMPTTYRRWSRKSWKCEEKHFLWKDTSLITYKDISAWQWDIAKCCHLRIFSNFFGDWIYSRSVQVEGKNNTKVETPNIAVSRWPSLQAVTHHANNPSLLCLGGRWQHHIKHLLFAQQAMKVVTPEEWH